MSDVANNRLAELLRDPPNGVSLVRQRDRHQPVAIDGGVLWCKGHHHLARSVTSLARYQLASPTADAWATLLGGEDSRACRR